MYYIVGDIGNTATKICLLNHKFIIIKSIIFDTNKIFNKRYFKNIIKKFVNKNSSLKLLFSSVVPIAYKEIKKNLKGSKYKAIEIKSLKIKKIIRINVKKINQLGSDRICNIMASKNLYELPAIIIDMGTATKYDVINQDGLYLGGAISP